MAKKGYMGLSAQAAGVDINKRHRWESRRPCLSNLVSGPQTTYTSDEKVSKVADQRIRASFTKETVFNTTPITKNDELYGRNKIRHGRDYKVETSSGIYFVRTNNSGRKILRKRKLN